MTKLAQVSDADLVREVFGRIKDSWQADDYFTCYCIRQALRPLYHFFDRQDIREANIKMRNLPPWDQLEEQMEAELGYLRQQDATSKQR